MQDFFGGSRPNAEKLIRYGFLQDGESYLLRRELVGGQFLLTVRVYSRGEVRTELIDAETGDPYTLHLAEEATGEFVGRVREEYARSLGEIALRCFDRTVFRESVTLALIERVRELYGDEPEYRWENFPDNAVWRRQDNGKWYGVLLTVEGRKLGMEREGKTEILDVRADEREIPLIVDGRRVFGGWHMNKKHWISLPLDGTVPLEDLENYLEESRRIAGLR